MRTVVTMLVVLSGLCAFTLRFSTVRLAETGEPRTVALAPSAESLDLGVVAPEREY